MPKMASNAFWQYGYNIWKMTPLDPPSPPNHMENSICLTGFFLKASLTETMLIIQWWPPGPGTVEKWIYGLLEAII